MKIYLYKKFKCSVLVISRMCQMTALRREKDYNKATDQTHQSALMSKPVDPPVND